MKCVDALAALAAGWGRGVRPDAAQMRAWSPTELQLFLQRLPRVLPCEDCAWLDANLQLTARGNYEILVEWLCIAAGSGYEPTFERVGQMLATVGRMKYVRPLYQALGKTEAGRALARAVFAQASSSYHGLTRRVAEGVIAKYEA